MKIPFINLIYTKNDIFYYPIWDSLHIILTVSNISAFDFYCSYFHTIHFYRLHFTFSYYVQEDLV